GEYGEGDVFIAVSNPDIHQAVKRFKPIELEACAILLQNQFHEVRFFALCMMIELYKPKKSHLKADVVGLYLNSTRFINNWDLVDCAAYKILGDYLLDKDRAVLFELAKSASLWERRIAIVCNFAFIKQNDFDTTFELADILLNDQEDLMHKAVGWMLKEVGKKAPSLLIKFLMSRYQQMPRMMLRTAIEKLPKNTRSEFLQ
ncbi:MAG: DNA alkylation repair protein, partial [Kangiellaceae bacterium]|nr:DNA alkylation repair protein [Kangiellaceae bacterium]